MEGGRKGRKKERERESQEILSIVFIYSDVHCFIG